MLFKWIIGLFRSEPQPSMADRVFSAREKPVAPVAQTLDECIEAKPAIKRGRKPAAKKAVKKTPARKRTK